jgi:hypothetical protein
MPRFGNFKALLLSLALLPASAFAINAQEPPRPTVIVPTTNQQQRIADKTRLYCAGYIRNQTLPHMPEIVGGVEEQEQRHYADGDVVYINAGSQQGIQQGQTFQIIRPRGEIECRGVHAPVSVYTVIE